MRKFRIDIETAALARVVVEISDERLAEIASELDVPVDELTVEDLEDEIAAEFDAPVICASCSGWGQLWGLELDDNWDISTDINGNTLNSIEELTDE